MKIEVYADADSVAHEAAKLIAEEEARLQLVANLLWR
jgi:hypothetical protein